MIEEQVTDEIWLSIIKNKYKDNKWRVNISHPDTLSAIHIGSGVGSFKEGTLSREQAERIFKIIKNECDFEDFQCTADDRNHVFTVLGNNDLYPSIELR